MIENDVSWVFNRIDNLPQEQLRLLVSEWAAKNRVIPEGLSPFPGPWRNDVTPYLIEIMDCFSESSPVRKVAIMKGTQLGLTTGILENDIGYIIDHAPAPTMFITGDQQMAEASIEIKIDKMLDSAGLSKKIFSQSENKQGKKTGNTKKKKEFPGGFLLAVGPNSGSKLRSFSVKNLLFDEIDAYPLQTGNEGDPIKIAEKRTDSFELTRKILYISTPLEKESSKINYLFGRGDQRFYFVPCIKCGHLQTLEFGQLKFEKDKKGSLIIDSVHYECIKCKAKWKNYNKVDFLAMESGAKWKPTGIPKEEGLRSYHINALYSPVGMKSWESICNEFISAQDDIMELKTFTNTVLGLPWEDQHHAPRPDSIMSNQGGYDRGMVPKEAHFITLGADVQGDRIECEVVAWSKYFESWSIDYKVFHVENDKLIKNGGPGAEDGESQVWSELYNYITSEFPIFGGGVMNLEIALIDSGYVTDTIYDFCSQFDGGVFPIMGDKYKKSHSVFTPRQVKEYNLTRFDLQTDHLKTQIYKNLRKEIIIDKNNDRVYPRGYCHFPPDYGRKYFDQLTAEVRKIEKQKNGVASKVWYELPPGRRNEALDCRVYAMAGVYIYAAMITESVYEEEGIDWPQFWGYCENIKNGV